MSELSESVRTGQVRTVKSVRNVRCVYNTGRSDTDSDMSPSGHGNGRLEALDSAVMLDTNALKRHEVVTQTQDQASSINELENAQDSDLPPARKADSVFLKRRQRRRLDLRSLDGTLREAARVYREIAEGKISLAEGEVRSRVLSRIKDKLVAKEQGAYLKSIDDRLAAIQAGRGFPALSPQSIEGDLR